MVERLGELYLRNIAGARLTSEINDFERMLVDDGRPDRETVLSYLAG